MPFMARILLDIFIIFAAAKLAGELFERIRQPAVIGEILAGILIGPYALGLIGHPEEALVTTFGSQAAAQEALQIVYQMLAQIGVIILLFFVGLETRIDDLLSVGPRAAIVGAMGMVLPFVFGYVLIASLGYAAVSAIFIATAMVATSVGITARVLTDMGLIGRAEAKIILGAAVVDDILGMILLAVVVDIGSTGIDWGQVALVAVEALAFTGFVILVGRHFIHRYDASLDLLRVRNGDFVFAIAVCLGLAALANFIGLAAIIGAFLAGLVFSEARQRDALMERLGPVYDLLVPFFFVVTGALVDPRLFLDGGIAVLTLAVTILAVAGKLIGCSTGAWGMGWRSAAIIGVGMVPRGEVGMIVAAIGLSLNVLPQELFSVVILMSVLTTLLVPPVLNVIVQGSDQGQ